jgi:hypothetical protein
MPAGTPARKVAMPNPQKPFAESGTSPPFRVTVTHVQITPGCTVALGKGIDECGRAVSFAGDWRPMLAIAEALERGETVEVHLHDHQILAWRRS